MGQRSGPRKTKIVATLGPACDGPGVLAALLEAGVNVFRVNLSHGDRSSHRERLDRARAAAGRAGAPVAVLVDTRGIEVRTGPVAGGAVELRDGAALVLRDEPGVGDASSVHLDLPGFSGQLAPGHRVLVDDGRIALRVLRTAPGRAECRVEVGGVLRDRRGVNFPDCEIRREDQPQRDREDLGLARDLGADYVAASFVQRADDIRRLRTLAAEAGFPVPLIAKIESRSGVKHLGAIVEEADGTMVARGDLGVELPLERVPILQKRLIAATVTRGKPVITATQMLDSMERNPTPTRAEVSDVANAILDGTSAVMLSGETAVGRHPVEAVRTLAAVAREAEAALEEFGALQHIRPSPAHRVADAVSQAAITMAHSLGAAGIVTLTETGFTSRSISKYRPRCPILAVTVDRVVSRRLALNWGVTPLHYQGRRDDETMIRFALDRARELGHAREGDLMVATAGRPRQAGSTDLIRVVRV